MKRDECDPDEAQLRDELDADWVRRWVDASKKKNSKSPSGELPASEVLPPKEEQLPQKRHR